MTECECGGLRYAFGYYSRFGHWDEIIIGRQEARRIIEFLQPYAEERDDATE